MSSSTQATVAEVIRQHGEAFLEKHPSPPEVHGLLGLLPLCRTEALGGYLYSCSECGHEKPCYRPCGNRHCPNCQTLAREQWVMDRERDLLELPYFHLVFTLPAELQALILQNKALCYNLLFDASAKTLLKFGRDPRHGLSGQVGFTSVLHTWDQTMNAHAHVHVLMPAGALSTDKQRFTVKDRGRWLFPVKALSRVFRALFLKGLKNAFKEGALGFWGKLEYLESPDAYNALLEPLYEKEWVVYAKRPFAGPEQVLGYLGRYTHRVALSNARIKAVDEQSVSFEYRDRKDASKTKTMTLSGEEFLRRFFLHVLPHGFTRIRHYGFLGNAVRKENLPIIRARIGQSVPPKTRTPVMERVAKRYGIMLNACPCCGKPTLHPARLISPTRCKGPPG